MASFLQFLGPKIRVQCTFNANGNVQTGSNVFSVTDFGTGQWAVNFQKYTPSANYSVGVSVPDNAGVPYVVNGVGVNPPTNMACRVYCYNLAGVLADPGGNISFTATE